MAAAGVNAGAAAEKSWGSLQGPEDAGHTPLHQVDPGGSCRLELGRRFSRGCEDGGGDSDLPLFSAEAAV